VRDVVLHAVDLSIGSPIIVSKYEPWLPRNAIEFVDQILEILRDNSDFPVHVMEHGAGTSTPWLAERCDYLLSFETDSKWYGQVGNMLRHEKLLDNTMLVFAPLIEEMGIKMPINAPREFDVIFVDGRGRVKFWEKARKYLKPGGWLVWDDAERPKYWGGKGLSWKWLVPATDWVWEHEEAVPVTITLEGMWPVYAYEKPEKKGSYTVFARNSYTVFARKPSA
jgi:predicted O-methyltransferase YrrM